MDIGWQELLLVLGVALVAFGFGSGRVPQLAKALSHAAARSPRQVAAPVPARPVAARADEV